MKLLSHRTLLSVAGLAIVPGLLSGQTTREVNQNDLLAAYLTITTAVQDALPGDVILVHPGTYQEGLVISGITLRALRGPEVTVIQSPDGTGDGVTLTGNQNVSLIGFRIQGFVRGVFVNTDAGNTKVSNCVVAGNSSDGVFIANSVPSSAKIVNNISADNGRHAFYIANGAYDPDKFYSSMFNNIAYRNGSYGFADIHSNPDITFGDYNCSFANTLGDLSDRQNSLGAHSITTDPILSAATHYRFISQSSPAVNTGHPSSFYNDPDGSPNDMGAYGGPEAANWWRDPFSGPTIENVTVDPPQVRPGGTITISATAKTE